MPYAFLKVGEATVVSEGIKARHIEHAIFISLSLNKEHDKALFGGEGKKIHDTKPINQRNEVADVLDPVFGIGCRIFTIPLHLLNQNDDIVERDAPQFGAWNVKMKEELYPILYKKQNAKEKNELFFKLRDFFNRVHIMTDNMSGDKSKSYREILVPGNEMGPKTKIKSMDKLNLKLSMALHCRNSVGPLCIAARLTWWSTLAMTEEMNPNSCEVNVNIELAFKDSSSGIRELLDMWKKQELVLRNLNIEPPHEDFISIFGDRIEEKTFDTNCMEGCKSMNALRS